MGGVFAVLLALGVGIAVLDSVHGALTEQPTVMFESKWMLPLKSNSSRETVLHLDPDSLGFLPEKLAMTSKAKSRVSFDFILQVNDKTGYNIIGIVEWSGTSCDIVPFPHTSSNDKVTGRMDYRDVR